MIIDLHSHTTVHSPCSIMSPDDMMVAAKGAGLDGICITEHNRIWAPDDARSLSERYGIAVFRGIEITTTGGDILVFGLEEEPDEMWTPSTLKEKVDNAGGVAVAAHPFRGFLIFGFSELQMDIEAAKDNPTFSQVHGLEICNSMVTDQENDMARQVADAIGLLKIGGSDAHDPQKVGTCVTVFEESIADERELVAAILSGKHHVERLK